MLKALRSEIGTYIFYFLLAVCLVLVIKTSMYLLAIFVAALLVFVAVAKRPLRILYVMICFVPFSSTPLLNDPLFLITGAKYLSNDPGLTILKPFNVLAAIFMAFGVFQYGKSRKVPKLVFWFTFIYVAIFCVSVFRTIPNLSTVVSMGLVEGGGGLSVSGYLFSFLIKPLIYFTPFVYIVKYCNSSDDVEKVIDVLVVSSTAISVMVLILYFIDVYTLETVSEVYHEYFGMHRNRIATFLIVLYPFLFAKVLRSKKLIDVVILTVSALSIAVLFSRTAYLAIVISMIVYLILIRKKVLVPILAIFVASVFVFGSVEVRERAMTGLDSRDTEVISAGRVEHIWIPLINEVIRDPKELMFGNGRYGMLSTSAARSGNLSIYNHPHNMYLELLVDSGLICMSLIMVMFYKIIKKVHIVIARAHDEKIKEIYYPVLVSIISFLISGMTGRSFFPTIDNSYFWIVMGLFICLGIQAESNGRAYEQSQDLLCKS